MTRSGWHAVDPPQRPVLFVNPRSGGGKAARAGLAERARERGIDVIVLRPDDDLAALVDDAVARGADALGVAGGDGSLAVVAAAALAHELPFVCVPAGTRNHFALDLGVDRHDLIGSLDAFTDGVERRIDVAEVNGRLFLNNVSLGIYGDAVRQPTYRDAKARTLLETAAHVLGPSAAAVDLQLVDDRGRPHLNPAVVLVSNNPYSLEPPHPPGTRPTLDSGQLGILVLDTPARRAASGTDVDRDASRGDRARTGARRHRRRGGRPHAAAPVRHPARRASRQDPVEPSRRSAGDVPVNVDSRKPADLSVGGLRPAPDERVVRTTWSFSFSLPTRSSTPAWSSALRFSRSVRRASRAAASAASSAASSSPMTSATGRRVTSPPSLYISRVDHLDRRLLDARDHGGRSRRDRPAENGERLVGGHGAIDVERAAHQGAGAPAEQDTDRPAQDADEHPDQRAARRADEADVVGALRDAQLALRRALDDRRGLQPDATLGVALLQHAQRLVGLARLREPNDHHVFLSH